MWRNLKSRFFVASGRIVVVVEIGDWSQERTLSQPMRPDWRLESACSESQRQCYNLQQTTTVQNTFPAPPLSNPPLPRLSQASFVCQGGMTSESNVQGLKSSSLTRDLSNINSFKLAPRRLHLARYSRSLPWNFH